MLNSHLEYLKTPFLFKTIILISNCWIKRGQNQGQIDDGHSSYDLLRSIRGHILIWRLHVGTILKDSLKLLRARPTQSLKINIYKLGTLLRTHMITVQNDGISINSSDSEEVY